MHINKLLAYIISLAAMVLIAIFLVYPHVIREYRDSLIISLPPQMGLMNEQSYNFTADVTFDIERQSFNYELKVFPYDSVITKSQVHIRRGDCCGKADTIEIKDFTAVQDTLKHKGSLAYRHRSGLCSNRKHHVGVTVKNFSNNHIRYTTNLKCRYPMEWECHSYYSPCHSDYLCSADYCTYSVSGNNEASCHIYLESPQKTLINNYIIIFLSALFSILLGKSVDEIFNLFQNRARQK